VQEARSTEQSAAKMALRSPFARLHPADFKVKFPLDVRSVRPWLSTGSRCPRWPLSPIRKRDLCQIRKPGSIFAVIAELWLLDGW